MRMEICAHNGIGTGVTNSSDKGTVRQKELEPNREALYPLLMAKHSPFRCFKTSPEIIRLTVMLYVRFPLLLRYVERPLYE